MEARYEPLGHPAQFPRIGLACQCEYHSTLAGNRVRVVASDESRVLTIRLENCDCDDPHTQTGREAKQYTEKRCCQCGRLLVLVDDLDALWLHLDGMADDVPGHIYLSSEVCLNDMLLYAGHAKRPPATESVA